MKSESKIAMLRMRGRSRSDLVGGVILGFIFGVESLQVIFEAMLDKSSVREVYLKCFRIGLLRMSHWYHFGGLEVE